MSRSLPQVLDGVFIYRAMGKQYNRLAYAPLLWLTVSCISSGLSSVMEVVGLYKLAPYGLSVWTNHIFYMCLFKNGNLLVYVYTLLIFLADMAI